ncbi:hypothetical protein CC78DRAFT_526520 [Lojkania enalia]|uniref:Uncharacterized protein n=1 Tax=Lojkania enalia TaxID=147567 RepID=A0A9P4JZ14_9PLEO|nr:hypothetical protein CC78DRAFT_526520 [Didymosphaeria enalia]
MSPSAERGVRIVLRPRPRPCKPKADISLRYPPANATPGQRPSVSQDIAPSTDFPALYITPAPRHQFIFQRNRIRGHKSLMSWAMFGFAMAQLGTMILRIARATRPDSGSVAPAASLSAFLGAPVIYVVVLILAMRVFRGVSLRLGWNAWLGRGIRITHGLLLIVTLVVVPFGMVTGFTRSGPDQNYPTSAPGPQKPASHSSTCSHQSSPSFPYSSHPQQTAPPENFGTGSIQSKLIILGIILLFTKFISGFRVGVIWAPYRPLSQLTWCNSRAAF